MKYYVFIADTPYMGTKEESYEAFETPLTEEELDSILQDKIQLNAENYEYLVTGWDDDYFDTEEEREEALNDYYDDCGGEYFEITKEQYENETYEE